MFIVRITSGLGNQMYQYNFYRYLKEKYPDATVKADTTWFYANDEHHGYELERIFAAGVSSDFEIEEASKGEILRVTGQVPAMIKGPLAHSFVYLMGPVNRIMRERARVDKSVNIIDQLNGSISNSNQIDENGEEINPLYNMVTNLDISEDKYFSGFWIEEQYYRDRLSKLKHELIFPEIHDSENSEMADQIESVNSVSLHVRRGDYLSDIYSSKFKTLGRDYYEKAVNCIREKIDNPKFFIFSDDAQFVRQEFDWLDNKVCVNINSGKNSFRDMQLMTLCKANIIANSTFSQWGSHLNKHPEHITIYPSTYLQGEDTEVKKLPGWIRM